MIEVLKIERAGTKFRVFVLLRSPALDCEVEFSFLVQSNGFEGVPTAGKLKLLAFGEEIVKAAGKDV